MALDLFADSTEHYRWTGSGLNYIGLKWTTAEGAKTDTFPDGSGRSALEFTANGGQLNKTMTYQNSWWVGFRFYLAGNLGTFGDVYSIAAAGEAVFGTVTVEHDQTVSLRAGPASGTVLFNTGSLTPPISLKGNTSYYIEIGIVTSGGSVSTPIDIAMTLKINGILMGSGSGATPYNTSQTLIGTNQVNTHEFTGFGVEDGFAYMRDFYISANGNAPYGDVSLGVVFPYANSTNLGWAPVGAAQLFAACNPTFPDTNDDTIYIFDNTPGDSCSFLFGPLSGTDPIPFVHFGVFHKKDAEGSRTFAQTMGGTDESPAPYISSGDDYRYDFQGFESPPGGGNWSVGIFNSTAFGVDIKA